MPHLYLSDLFQPLLFLLFVPIFAIGLILAKFPARPVAISAALLNFATALGLLFTFQSGIPGYQFVIDTVWCELPLLPSIHFHIGLDGINLPLLLLTTLVTLSAVSLPGTDVKRPSEFYLCLLLMSLGAIGAFISLDLFFFFIAHEFALIPTFLLIGIWGSQNRQLASMQITLYLTVGSMILLAGIIFLVQSLPVGTRTFDLVQIQSFFFNHPYEITTKNEIFLLLFLGFGILFSLFPFHSWAPTGYAAAPPAAAMLHAGVLKKFGLYGLIRVALPLLPGGIAAWQPFISFLLVGNLAYIALVTLAQKELSIMVGFSSVMHMGYLLLGIVSFNQIGLCGVVFLMVAHGLSTALLFALSGEITRRTGENRFAELGGLGSQTPFLAGAFIFASLASIGLPGLANFNGEILIFFGAWQNYPKLTLLALWGVVWSSVYQLRAVNSVCFGEVPAKFRQVTDLKGLADRAPYLLLITAILVFGFVPQLLFQVVQPSVSFLFPGR